MAIRRVRERHLLEKKAAGEPIIQLAVTNYRDAVVSDRNGADIITASDVVAQTQWGRAETQSVTLEEMVIVGAAVRRGAPRALVTVAMPYWSFQPGKEVAVRNAGFLVQQTGADGVEMEVSRYHAPLVRAVVEAGIPVQAHIGLSAQRIAQLGGARGLGKTLEEAKEFIDDARDAVSAGAFSIVCELLSTEVMAHLRGTLKVPVISLGSGPEADGQGMVYEDIFGMYEEHIPRHSKVFEPVIESYQRGMDRYLQDVRAGEFPAGAHSIAMPADEAQRLRRSIRNRAAAKPPTAQTATARP